LLAWAAKNKQLIEGLIYVDDSFGIEDEGRVEEYTPYGEKYPVQQAKLLRLWDEIGIPHKQRKQVHGQQLTILGIEVDVDKMMFTLPQESKIRLEDELADWCQKGVCRKVREWQQLAGWVNWALNVYPLLRPALNNLYSKIQGKDQKAKVWANKAINKDLEWAREKVGESDGVLLLRSVSWEIEEATCVMETDACPGGIAFWYLATKRKFVATNPPGTPSTLIIFYEALAVLSALQNAHHTFPSQSKIVIYMDNFPTVSMFSSLRALPDYNCILRAAVDILLEGKHELRVIHISGESNSVADALS